MKEKKMDRRRKIKELKKGERDDDEESGEIRMIILAMIESVIEY